MTTNSLTYDTFLERKRIKFEPCGLDVNSSKLNSTLFPFQQAVVKALLKLGRGALFANTGLGKTGMQLEWANTIAQSTGDSVLILAPLAVAKQTAFKEAAKFGIQVKYCESQAGVGKGINITNYEKLHKFSSGFAGLVLDESSLIKNESGKMTEAITTFASDIPYRLACSATPVPNDFMEFGTHAEFLGIMSRAEMLATFFKHDGGETSKWRLKGWGESEFWKWLCSWSIAFRMPSDIGYADDGYLLPPLVDHKHVVEGRLQPKEGELVATIGNMNDRRRARKASLADRVAVAAELANNSDEPWMIWCELNDEGDALEAAIKDGYQIAGKDTPEQKEQLMTAFSNGDLRVLISKPSICGSGMNWQHCRNVCFVGINDSWESLYQATNRFHRFGQTQQVNRHLVFSADEFCVFDNLERKKRQADRMWAEFAKRIKDFSLVTNPTQRITTEYNPTVEMKLPEWLAA